MLYVDELKHRVSRSYARTWPRFVFVITFCRVYWLATDSFIIIKLSTQLKYN